MSRINCREEQARENIVNKINLIKHWSSNGIPIKTDADGNELYIKGVPRLYRIPETKDAFRRWKDVNFQISSTNETTFKNFFNTSSNDFTLAQLESELKKLKLKFEDQLSIFTKSGKKALEEKIANQNKLIKVQNDEIADLILEQSELKGQISDIMEQIRDIEIFFEAKITAKDKEIKRLNDTLGRFRSLKEVPND
ncbi:hypothetical protein [Vibrio parahaemolyticus]|uniref:hypothetical protein n=1 Tax=Vibrio parahaemolyticus TaxID=670 RepID=UPI00084BA612|nr:hypothetical protein [Vibrio parahaemolyticus]EGQ7856012.1 SlyX family protein [Vibrio parahaemolyticus]EGR2249984.1 hypothetical protein [Vibrio parahaemolyticus]MDF4713746.1 hypothetical protein [Vibrio parahaemolyticus]ODX85159.1 hypothetical protein BBM92_14245 [Vibrio parahaemolyticus]ODY08699.1 hypothetical protein BBM15_21130 [Vibrio parahaemolyticus]